MTERERWISSIKCDDCGNSGAIVFSEEDHPFEDGSRGIRVEACPPGFEVIRMVDRGGARVVCAKCRSVVHDTLARDDMVSDGVARDAKRGRD